MGACNLSPEASTSRLRIGGYAYSGETTAFQMVTDYL